MSVLVVCGGMDRRRLVSEDTFFENKVVLLQMLPFSFQIAKL